MYFNLRKLENKVWYHKLHYFQTLFLTRTTMVLEIELNPEAVKKLEKFVNTNTYRELAEKNN